MGRTNGQKGASEVGINEKQPLTLFCKWLFFRAVDED